MSVIDLLRRADPRPFLTDVGTDGANGPLHPVKVLELRDLIRGAALRATKGDWYIDSGFAHNVQIMQDAERPWCPYHVLYSTHTLAKQRDHIFRAVPNPGPWKRRILDIETTGAARVWSDLTWGISEACLSEDGKRPIIYSRTNLVNQWLVPYWTNDMLNAHYWHFAAYFYRATAIARWTMGRTGEYLGSIALPRLVVGGQVVKEVQKDRVILHQTGDTAPAFSLYPPPKGSYKQDTDRWLHQTLTPDTFGQAI